MITFKESSKGLCFHIYASPRASKNVIVGCHQGALKIKLTAPPVDGAANKQCIRILAKALAVPNSAITIVSGHNSRRKIACIDADIILDREAKIRIKSRLTKLGAT